MRITGVAHLSILNMPKLPWCTACSRKAGTRAQPAAESLPRTLSAFAEIICSDIDIILETERCVSLLFRMAILLKVIVSRGTGLSTEVERRGKSSRERESREPDGRAARLLHHSDTSSCCLRQDDCHQLSWCKLVLGEVKVGMAWSFSCYCCTLDAVLHCTITWRIILRRSAFAGRAVARGGSSKQITSRRRIDTLHTLFV